MGLSAGLLFASSDRSHRFPVARFNVQGQASGLGWGIAVMPSLSVIAAMLAITLTVATAVALLLARRSARAPEPLAPPRRPLAIPRPTA